MDAFKFAVALTDTGAIRLASKTHLIALKCEVDDAELSKILVTPIFFLARVECHTLQALSNLDRHLPFYKK